MKTVLLASLFCSAAMLSSAAIAESAYGESHPRIHEVEARLAAQNKRIDSALALGKISAAEAAKLHAEDAAIASELATDKTFDKGHITRADEVALNQQENVVSREIAQAAGETPHPRIAEVKARLAKQNDRIDHAFALGKITSPEADRLHTEDGAIASELATDKALDKGHITKAEWVALNQQENVVSHQISHAAGGGHASGSSHSGGKK